ncbi:hypothetical protein QC764_0087390 [Podospora pseudoanserina]|uniref:Uncharacterized protein n=1 Tax=Podospora pseudoanserina TaxID=2609844 RepID=A0ABR0I7F9_9PEZI|nr:hypothetical protein QC764_0087390 [Podospora pseudoanserina]
MEPFSWSEADCILTIMALAWHDNNVAQLMVGEANAVLSIEFDCPTYLVVPEQRMPPRRFDLAILKVATNQLFFRILKVTQCFQAIRLGQGYTYGMRGRGPECSIVKYDGAI